MTDETRTDDPKGYDEIPSILEREFGGGRSGTTYYIPPEIPELPEMVTVYPDPWWRQRGLLLRAVLLVVGLSVVGWAIGPDDRFGYIVGVALTGLWFLALLIPEDA